MGNIQYKVSDLHPEYADIFDFEGQGVPVFIEDKFFRLAEPTLGGTFFFRDPSNIEDEIASGRLVMVGSFRIIDRDPTSFAPIKVRLTAIEVKPPKSA